ncbi:MAG: DUF4410 domain-containing protein [Deltaproteobacteria bacterium]|nr:DUF4410 domain-containing protein [Deltaproteobacteria bacterium]
MGGKIRDHLLMIGCLLLAGCANVKLTGRRELAPVPEVTPSIIYVADFTLEPQSLRVETGILPVSPVSSDKSDESETLLPKLVGMPVERAVRARELVNLMTTSLVEDLRNLGLNAYRLSANSQAAADGWLVRGTFIRIDEGNRIRRALIGFGDGETELEVLTSLSDLPRGAPRPFCALNMEARSSRRAGAMISFDPYETLGRFMVDGLDLDKNVMESAGRLAREIAQTIQHHNCAAGG